MLVETLFSPTTLLWLIGSAMAVAILLGAINRRRTRLEETLRNYVDRHQQAGDSERSDRNQAGDR